MRGMARHLAVLALALAGAAPGQAYESWTLNSALRYGGFADTATTVWPYVGADATRESLQRMAPLSVTNFQPEQINQAHADAAQAGLVGGGSAEAGARVAMGMIKAYAEAWSPRVVAGPAGGEPVHASAAQAQASFMDTLWVDGAGLAAGTPVAYTALVDIHGLMAAGLAGSFTHFASASVSVRLHDRNADRYAYLQWAATQGFGSRALTLATQVGNDMEVWAGVTVTAQSHSAPGGRTLADLGHTLRLALQPSAPGLATVGASGHDWAPAAVVPEPGGAALAVAGLALLAWRVPRRGRWR